MKKTPKKESPTSKSHVDNTKKILHMATEQMYQIALKSIISSIVPHCPKEILIEISKFINTIYLKLEDHCLNTVIPNNTVKRREIIWKNVTSKVQEILFLLLQVVKTEQKPLLDISSSSQTNNIMKIESLPDNNHSRGRYTLNHAIKAYAHCCSAKKKID